jgi:hypothetical protein
MPITSWLWIAAGLYLLYEIWRGWRRGVARHGLSVFALVAAGGIGWIFAWITGPIADRILPFPVPAGRVVFGFAAGLAFYLSAVVLSSLLFKKTSQQSSGIVRLVYGVGGGFFGLIFGLVVLWGGISLVRMLGAVSEGQQAPPSEISAPAGGEQNGQGLMSRFVDKVDPVPPVAYGLITKFIRVTRSPEATARFFSCPEVQQLLHQPKVAALFADPGVAEAASGGNIFSVMTSPRIAEVAGDPEVQKSISGFDLEKALDYALQTPPTSPAP